MNSHQTNDLIRQREGALSNLDIAYKHFKDITGNLEEGIIVPNILIVVFHRTGRSHQQIPGTLF
jgi:hypothetical protein